MKCIPLKPHFYILVLKLGIQEMIFLFLFKNIHYGYSNKQTKKANLYIKNKPNVCFNEYLILETFQALFV